MRKEVITETDPKSPVSEIFRALRTNLQYMKRKAGCQTILYTSTIQGEGKSFVALNTAVTFAQAGKNVLIIDADMRRPRQHKVFEVSQYPGLSNYLSGVDPDDNFKKIKLDECIKKTSVDKLYIMPAGVIPPNPSELLETPKLPRLIEKLEQVFDIVIIDGAPCLLVTDSTIISRYADSTVLVAASGKARIDDLREAKARIQHVGGNLVGIVLNRVRTTKSKYESKYYYASNDRSTKSSKSSSYNRATHVSGMKKKPSKKAPVQVEEEQPRVIERAYDSRNKEDREIKKLGLEEEEDFSAKSEKTLKKEISKIKDFEIDEKTESDILRGLGADNKTKMPLGVEPTPAAEEPKSKDSTQVLAGLDEIRKKARSKYNFDDLDTATSNIEKAAEIEDIDIPLFSKSNVKKPHDKKVEDIDDDINEEFKEELKEAINLNISNNNNNNNKKKKKDKKHDKKNEQNNNDKKKSGKHDKENKDRYKSKIDDDYEPPLTNEKDQQKIDDILSKINRYK